MESLDNKNPKEFTLSELFNRVKKWVTYLKFKTILVVAVLLIGFLLGAGYVILKPAKYTARLSFVVEDSKSSIGGLASIAGQFGIDVNSLAGSSSVLLSGDNVILFLKSKSIIREVLISPYDSVTNRSLMDVYCDVYKLRKNWAGKLSLGRNIYFPYNQQKYTRLQDSLLQSVSDKLTDNLYVGKVDKKASFVEVESTFKDELLSKYFVERLVQFAVERYLESKVHKQQKIVQKLQRRSDSLELALNIKTRSSAFQQEKLLDLNPGAKAETVNISEVILRDKTIASAIYVEVVKNLEMAKFQLSQETPTIQMVDQVLLPLRNSKEKLFLNILLTGLSGAVLFFVVIFSRSFISHIFNFNNRI
jgi:hypothetical protein